MIVRGCLTCGGSEHPARTFTAMFRDREGRLEFGWVCQECVGALGVERLRDLTEADIFCLNEQMREAYERGQIVWTGDCPPGLVLESTRAKAKPAE